MQLGTLSGTHGDVPVAIKTPKDDDDELQKELLIEEMKIMAYLQEGFPHENVLKMIGCVTNKEHFCLLTEYCELGSLDKFLRKTIYSNKFEHEIVYEEYDHFIQSIKTTYKVCIFLIVDELSAFFIIL